MKKILDLFEEARLDSSVIISAFLKENNHVGYYTMDILLNGWEIIPPAPALLLGGITWVLIIEAVRRTGGPVLAAVILVVSLYPLFAFMLPAKNMLDSKHWCDRLV